MFTEKFYEKFTGPCGLNDVRLVELDKTTSTFYFDIDYPQPMTGFLLSAFDDFGESVFRFVLVTGYLQYNSAGIPESIEYAIKTSSGLEFYRFYFNNPYGHRIYLFDR